MSVEGRQLALRSRATVVPVARAIRERLSPDLTRYRIQDEGGPQGVALDLPWADLASVGSGEREGVAVMVLVGVNSAVGLICGRYISMPILKALFLIASVSRQLPVSSSSRLMPFI
jgi:hypothetical protein